MGRLRATTAPKVTGQLPTTNGRNPAHVTRVAASMLGALLGLAVIDHGVSHVLGMTDAALVAALTAFSFTVLVVALVAAWAHDRARLRTS